MVFHEVSEGFSGPVLYIFSTGQGFAANTSEKEASDGRRYLSPEVIILVEIQKREDLFKAGAYQSFLLGNEKKVLFFSNFYKGSL